MKYVFIGYLMLCSLLCWSQEKHDDKVREAPTNRPVAGMNNEIIVVKTLTDANGEKKIVGYETLTEPLTPPVGAGVAGMKNEVILGKAAKQEGEAGRPASDPNQPRVPPKNMPVAGQKNELIIKTGSTSRDDK